MNYPHRTLFTRTVFGIIASLLITGSVLFTITGCTDDESSSELIDWEIENLEKELEQDPDNLDNMVNLALLYQDAGRHGKAEEQLKAVLDEEPNYTDALFSLGFIYIDEQEYQKALDPLEKVVELNQDNPMRSVNRQLEAVYYYLGIANNELGRYQEAASALNEALLIDRMDADAWYLLGTVYLNSEEYTVAIASYKQALRFVPDYREVYQGLAACYKKTGQIELASYAEAMVDFCSDLTDEAIARLEEIVATSQEYGEIFLGLGLAYEKKGEIDKAIEAYEEAFRLQPELWLAEMKIKALSGK